MSVVIKEKFKIEYFQQEASDKYSVLEDLEKYFKKDLKRNESKIAKVLKKYEERLTRLRVNGTNDGMPAFDHIRASSPPIEEIRFAVDKKQYRFFIALYSNSNTYVILHCILGKTSQKTPKSDIETAENRMCTYLLRKESE